MMFLIFILAISIVSAYFNYEIINRKNWHSTQAFLRVLTFGAILLVPEAKTKATFIILLIEGLAIYWIFFDLFLNLYRFGYKKPFYIGATGAIDKFFSRQRQIKIPKKKFNFTFKYLMYLIKILLLLLTIYQLYNHG